MSDWPERLDRFVEALRRGRRPERGLAGLPEEVEDLRRAARLAGARSEFADPDPSFLTELRARLGLDTRLPPPRRVRVGGRTGPRLPRSGFLRAAGLWVAGLASGVGPEWVWQRSQVPEHLAEATPTAAGQWYPVAALASLPIDAVRPVAPASIPAFILRDGHSVRALSRVCTHQACLLQFDSSEREIYCPCHGAVFDLFGQLVPGYYLDTLPPLPAFEVRVVNEIVYVRA